MQLSSGLLTSIRHNEKVIAYLRCDKIVVGVDVRTSESEHTQNTVDKSFSNRKQPLQLNEFSCCDIQYYIQQHFVPIEGYQP